MATFYGTLKGSRGEATRCGTKGSGMTTYAASWLGAIRVELSMESDGRVHFLVTEQPWHGSGRSRLLATGHIGEDFT